ncbi:alanine racemase [Hyphobacterium sp. HN65]|uniref:Alanine racemase n=1 Tax=Hyphobacterium lacteum TaxID=3116575 RepID=A0ABU7LP32_9PROT|nr:alanine racemase [Hyphobacterium sp. HN65]MEE2525679.1 alanine racemase [Hyphobacterium sp. HN65]
MLSRPRLTIDLDAIAANYRLLQETVSPAECAAVIKADAYGMGAEAIGRHLLFKGCRAFFFAHPGEAAPLAAEIAEAGGRVFILNGLGGYTVRDFTDSGLIPVLNSLDEAWLWMNEAGDKPAALHLDTGMNRLGLPAIDDAAVQALQQQGLNLVHIMSHFACSEEPANPRNREQIERFTARYPAFGIAERSISNSAGCFLGSDAHFEMVRPGLALYGPQPSLGNRADLKIPYLFEAPVLQVRRVQAGETVGYGATHVFKTDGWSATIGAGYADGVPRCLSNRTHVFVGGKTAPIIGRVSMDSTVIDLTLHENPQSLAHARAQIYGPDIPVETQAEAAGLSPYELLTRIGGRTERAFKGRLD